MGLAIGAHGANIQAGRSVDCIINLGSRKRHQPVNVNEMSNRAQVFEKIAKLQS
ncbi:Hypothetical protein FKW44_001956 [Caligus rogercresseyi]|uniref:Uncharacterized protein n=1 Tax=Caligus rogercresseyi TaxID=217165 RepID=A0A7T8KJU5_CALRO|nr:Hypothetical protein FKW44_001956 [Caligus rogercresseyi]